MRIQVRLPKIQLEEYEQPEQRPLEGCTDLEARQETPNLVSDETPDLAAVDSLGTHQVG